LNHFEISNTKLPISKAPYPEDLVWENIEHQESKYAYYFLLTFIFIVSGVVSYGVICFMKMFEFVQASYGT